jgi:hypothetical protein
MFMGVSLAEFAHSEHSATTFRITLTTSSVPSVPTAEGIRDDVTYSLSRPVIEDDRGSRARQL